MIHDQIDQPSFFVHAAESASMKTRRHIVDRFCLSLLFHSFYIVPIIHLVGGVGQGQVGRPSDTDCRYEWLGSEESVRW